MVAFAFVLLPVFRLFFSPPQKECYVSVSGVWPLVTFPGSGFYSPVFPVLNKKTGKKTREKFVGNNGPVHFTKS